MPHKFKLLCALVALLLAPPSISAQERVVALPGANSSDEFVHLLQPGTLHDAGGLNAAAGAFKVFMSTDGTRLFVLSNSSESGSLTVTDLDGAAIGDPSTITNEIAAAEVTPNGRMLLVLSSDGVSVFDLTTSPVNFLGVLNHVGSNARDLAVSLDSRRAYVLNPGERRLFALDLTDLVGQMELELPTGSQTVTVGPNGLIYVTTDTGLMEIDETGEIGELVERKTVLLPSSFRPVGASADGRGKPAFSPDGKRMVMANRSATSPAAVVYSLETGNLQSVSRNGFMFQQLFAAANSYGYTIGSNGDIWGFNYSSTAPYTVQFDFQQPVRWGVLSQETPRAASLYVLTDEAGDTWKVTRVDLNTFRAEESTEAFGRQLAYVRPGYTGAPSTLAGTVTSVTVAPGERVPPLVVRASDNLGRALMNRAVTWAADPAFTQVFTMAATNVGGYAQAVYTAPSVAGTYNVTATVGGLNVQFTVTVSATNGGGNGGGNGDEGRIRLVSGQGQVMRVNTDPVHPITVQVVDSDGEPVTDAEVEWTLETLRSGSASINCQGYFTRRTCDTDADGKSTIEFHGLGVTAVGYAQFKLTATSGGDSAVVYATVIPRDATFKPVIVAPSSSTTLTLQRGAPLAGAIRVRARTGTETETGRAIPNVGVSVTPDKPGFAVQCADGWALTDADGLASCDLLATAGLGQTAVAIDVGGTAPDSETLVTVLVTPGPPSAITKVSGDGQSGRPGQTLPMHLKAELRDAGGTPLTGAAATWEVVSGSATLNPAGSNADAFGHVSTQVTLGATPGPVVIRVRAGSAQADFTVTNDVEIIGFAKVSGDNQSAPQGGPFASPLVVQVNGVQGPVVGVPVNFTVTSGTATLSSSSAPTDASGRASMVVTAGNTPGGVTVSASIAGQQPQTFSLAVRPPGPVLTPKSFVNGASFEAGDGLGFGSIATIQADGLLSGSPAIATGTCIASNGPGPLPTSLANIEVLFSGHLAPIFSVCRTVDNGEQVSVQVPFELAPATIPVTVRTGIGTGTQIDATVPDIRILNASPGVFQWQTGGKTMAVGIRPDGTVVDASNSARRGEVLRIFATGLGPVLPWVGTNQLGTSGQRTYFTPIVTLGGSGVSGVTAAYAENQIGLFTIDFTVPSSASTGDVQLRLDVLTDTGDIVTGNTVTIPIQ